MKKLNINTVLLSTVAVIISLFFVLKTDNVKEISVVGRCSKQVKKDKFSITSTIKNLDKEASVALSKTLSTYKQVSDYLKELQKSNTDLEIETTDYSTVEKKEWNEKLRKNEKVGVESLISLKVITSNPEILSQIAFDLGKFDNVYTSNFNNFVSDTLFNTETHNCIKDAMLNAKEQAELIASSLNQNVGKMISANYYSNENFVQSSGRMYKASLAAVNDTISAEPATIFSGSRKIDISIDVKFELK